jgi:hypothetical protein
MIMQHDYLTDWVNNLWAEMALFTAVAVILILLIW